MEPARRHHSRKGRAARTPDKQAVRGGSRGVFVPSSRLGMVAAAWLEPPTRRVGGWAVAGGIHRLPIERMVRQPPD